MREVEPDDQEAWRAKVRAVQESMRTLADVPSEKPTKLKSKEAPEGRPAKRLFRPAFLPTRH